MNAEAWRSVAHQACRPYPSCKTRNATSQACDRLACEEGCDSAKFPAAQRISQEAVGRVTEERQIINIIHGQYLSTIQVRGGVPAFQVGIVNSVSRLIVCTGRIVQCVRPCVCNLEGQAMAEAMSVVNLQGIIIGQGS